MSDAHIEDISSESVNFDVTDIRNKLLPVLKQDGLPRKKALIEVWANNMLDELRHKLSYLLPLKENESDFIRLLREKGEIKPDLITTNQKLIEAVTVHPLIKWKAMKFQANG